MASPPSSPVRMTSPVTHRAQTPFPTNMDCSSLMSTPARQNQSAEAPYATPENLNTVNIPPLISSPAFSRNFLAFTGVKAFYYENG